MDQRELKDETAIHEVARHFRMLAWLKRSQLLRLVRDTAQAWHEDKAPRLGAALAFYTALSLARNIGRPTAMVPPAASRSAKSCPE